MHSSPSQAFADVEYNGDLDLFTGDHNGNTFFFRNTASAGATTTAFATPIENPLGIVSTAVDGYAAPVFGDLLGDDTVDLIFGSQDGEILAFRNKESEPGMIISSLDNQLNNVDPLIT